MREPSPFAQTIERVRLDRLPISARASITKDLLHNGRLSTEEFAEMMLNKIVIRLDTHCWQMEGEEVVVRWPDGWKQALKGAIPGPLGRWFRKRWPIRLAEERVKRYLLCPHMRGPNDRHFEFFSTKGAASFEPWRPE